MPPPIVIGEANNAVGGILTLSGGRSPDEDTIYVLAIDGPLADDSPWWSISVHIIDGPGDALAELSKGNDQVYLGAGADWIKLGTGDDLVYAGPGEDLVMGGAGNDRLYLGSEDDLGVGGYGDDVLELGAGNDQGFGGHGADRIRSGDGDDFLSGQDGPDALIHDGVGVATMLGGEDADVFQVKPGDRVFDFTPVEGDVLLVDGLDVSTEWQVWIGPGGVIAAPPGETEAVVLVPDGGV